MSQSKPVKESKQSEVSDVDVPSVKRQPAIFINHGAGPMPYLQHIQGEEHQMRWDQSFFIDTCKQLGKYIERFKPRALCVVSAHWETQKPTVLYHKSPPLLYDYGGFPAEAYQLKYPADCDMEITDRVIELFKQVEGYENVQLEKKRGYDHGVFVPLIIARPKADIPLIQVALHAVTRDKDQTAKDNLRLGAVLGKLRDEGVMIVGSGMSYHAFGGPKQSSVLFDEWLAKTLTEDSAEACVLKLHKWYKAPSAMDCHRREEHLLPLHVCLGSNMDIETIDALLKNGNRSNKQVVNKMKIDVERKLDNGIAYSGFTLF